MLLLRLADLYLHGEVRGFLLVLQRRILIAQGEGLEAELLQRFDAVPVGLHLDLVGRRRGLVIVVDGGLAEAGPLLRELLHDLQLRLGGGAGGLPLLLRPLGHRGLRVGVLLLDGGHLPLDRLCNDRRAGGLVVLRQGGGVEAELLQLRLLRLVLLLELLEFGLLRLLGLPLDGEGGVPLGLQAGGGLSCAALALRLRVGLCLLDDLVRLVVERVEDLLRVLRVLLGRDLPGRPQDLEGLRRIVRRAAEVVDGLLVLAHALLRPLQVGGVDVGDDDRLQVDVGGPDLLDVVPVLLEHLVDLLVREVAGPLLDEGQVIVFVVEFRVIFVGFVGEIADALNVLDDLLRLAGAGRLEELLLFLELRIHVLQSLQRRLVLRLRLFVHDAEGAGEVVEVGDELADEDEDRADAEGGEGGLEHLRRDGGLLRGDGLRLHGGRLPLCGGGGGLRRGGHLAQVLDVADDALRRVQQTRHHLHGAERLHQGVRAVAGERHDAVHGLEALGEAHRALLRLLERLLEGLPVVTDVPLELADVGVHRLQGCVELADLLERLRAHGAGALLGAHVLPRLLQRGEGLLEVVVGVRLHVDRLRVVDGHRLPGLHHVVQEVEFVLQLLRYLLLLGLLLIVGVFDQTEGDEGVLVRLDGGLQVAQRGDGLGAVHAEHVDVLDVCHYD